MTEQSSNLNFLYSLFQGNIRIKCSIVSLDHFNFRLRRDLSLLQNIKLSRISCTVFVKKVAQIIPSIIVRTELKVKNDKLAIFSSYKVSQVTIIMAKNHIFRKDFCQTRLYLWVQNILNQLFTY